MGRNRQQVRSDIPTKRLGHCDDIANLVAFLASPAGRYITGQIWAVDGGRNAGKDMAILIPKRWNPWKIQRGLGKNRLRLGKRFRLGCYLQSVLISLVFQSFWLIRKMDTVQSFDFCFRKTVPKLSTSVSSLFPAGALLSVMVPSA